MRRVILLTVILNVCLLLCSSHPNPSVQNVEIFADSSYSGSDSLNVNSGDEQKSRGTQSSSTCGYEVRLMWIMAHIIFC
jgi:hypothetical protein